MTRFHSFAGFLLTFLLSLGSLNAIDSIPFWKIEHQNGAVYLLGSIHLLKENITPLDSVIENAFKESDILAVEAHIGSKNMLENSSKMFKAGTFEKGETIQEVLSVQSFDDVKRFVKDMDIDIGMFMNFKPWMLALTISSISMLKQGFNPMFGVDFYYINRAEQRNMIIDELEGVDYQLNLFTKMTRQEEELFLVSTLKEQKGEAEKINDLVSAWRMGDLGKLSDLVGMNVKEMPELKNFYDTLLNKRNAEMSQKVEQYVHDQKKCFYIVGAAHLVGKKGIVEILRDKGFTVIRL